MKESILGYVKDINANIQSLESRGDFSKYTLPDEDLRGSLHLTFDGHHMDGIACSKGSLGNKALVEAVKHVKGSVKPYSIMGR